MSAGTKKLKKNDDEPRERNASETHGMGEQKLIFSIECNCSDGSEEKAEIDGQKTMPNPARS